MTHDEKVLNRHLKIIATEMGARLIKDAGSLGYEYIEPDIFIPGDVVLDIAGEDIRSRMLITTNQIGVNYALRADYTIPISRYYLDKLNNSNKHQVHYCYCGSVFRIRHNVPGESLQAGIEIIGDNDPITSDVTSLQFALNQLKQFGCNDARIIIGDTSLFSSLLASLDLAPAWQSQLLAAFGNDEQLAKILDSDDASHGAGSIDGSNHDQQQTTNGGSNGATLQRHHTLETNSRQIINDIIATIGSQPTGVRSPDEIANRLIAQMALKTPIARRKKQAIKDFLSFSGNPQTVLNDLSKFFSGLSKDFDNQIINLATRLYALEQTDIDLDRLRFATAFGRHIDYYTGFIFECRIDADTIDADISDKGQDLIVAAGGRYDGLFKRLGHNKPVSAVGAALWLDRLALK